MPDLPRAFGPLPWAVDVPGPQGFFPYAGEEAPHPPLPIYLDHSDSGGTGGFDGDAVAYYWRGFQAGIPDFASNTLLRVPRDPESTVTEVPTLGTVDACEPFWRIKRMKASFANIVVNTTSGPNTISGSIYLQALRPDNIAATSELDLPFCNRFESVDPGTISWSGTLDYFSPGSGFAGGSSASVVAFQMYFAMFTGLDLARGEMLHALTQPMLALHMPPVPAVGPSGDTDVYVFGQDYVLFPRTDYPGMSPDCGTNLVVDLRAHWPTHYYTIPLDCIMFSGPDASGFIAVGSGTGAPADITIAPAETDAYWTYGGKYDADTGAPV